MVQNWQNMYSNNVYSESISEIFPNRFRYFRNQFHQSCGILIALLFEAALGLEPVALVNMQTRYNIQTARKDNNFAKRLETIREFL